MEFVEQYFHSWVVLSLIQPTKPKWTFRYIAQLTRIHRMWGSAFLKMPIHTHFSRRTILTLQ